MFQKLSKSDFAGPSIGSISQETKDRAQQAESDYLNTREVLREKYAEKTERNNVTGLWQKLPTDPRDNGPHYSIFRLAGDGMDALRKMFPEANADEMNFVLFSTSGCGGTYTTIEQAEASKDTEPQGVSFVVIQPRIICMRYGNVRPVTDEDFDFLKALRASSQKAIAGIGF